MAGDEPLVKEVFIDAPPDEVFPYLVEGQKYLLWMGTDVDLDPRPGGTFRLIPNGRDVIEGEYLEVDPPRRVVFTWGFAQPGHEVPPGSTRVEIELTPQGNGTLLRLTHHGLSGSWRERHARGWDHYLGRLRTVAEGREPPPDSFADPGHRHG